MPGLSCRLFRSPKVAARTLRDKLATYRWETREEGFDRPLKESISDFRLEHGRAEFTFFFDFVFNLPSQPRPEKVLLTASAQVAIIDPPRESLYYIYGQAGTANGVRPRLSRALGEDDEFIDRVQISPETLRGLLEKDAIEAKYCWWDGIDTYARKGALKGNLFKSKYYAQFKNASPTSIMFESRSAGRTIRIGATGGVTFFGADVTAAELEDYVSKRIV